MDENYNNLNKYKLLLENAKDIMMVILDNKIEFINQKPLEDLGYTIDNVSDKSIFDFIYVDDIERVNEFQIKKVKNEGLPEDLIFRIVCKNGKLLFVKIISITTQWENKPARLVCLKNITDKKLNELTVKKSELLLFSIIDNLPDPTFIIDVNGKVYLWNKALEKISGVKSRDIIGKKEFEYAIPFYDYKGRLIIDLFLKTDNEIEKEYDFFQRNKDILIAGRVLTSALDKNIHIWATSSILYDVQGDIIGVVESFRDMSEIQNTEDKIKALIKEKEILLKEIHHRVNNNMALINSMLTIQLQYVKDPGAVDLFKDSISRIQTMSLIQNDLYKFSTYADINFEEFIPKLIDNLDAMYKNEKITIKTKAEHIHLGIDEAIPLGLILNELLSNSLKHAFLEKNKGLILIKLFFNKNTRLCNLIVHDNGKGLPNDFDFNKNTTSFGLLMVNLLSSQLHGTIRLNKTHGTEFIIAFPIKIGNH